MSLHCVWLYKVSQEFTILKTYPVSHCQMCCHETEMKAWVSVLEGKTSCCLCLSMSFSSCGDRFLRPKSFVQNFSCLHFCIQISKQLSFSFFQDFLWKVQLRASTWNLIISRMLKKENHNIHAILLKMKSFWPFSLRRWLWKLLINWLKEQAAALHFWSIWLDVGSSCPSPSCTSPNLPDSSYLIGISQKSSHCPSQNRQAGPVHKMMTMGAREQLHLNKERRTVKLALQTCPNYFTRLW